MKQKQQKSAAKGEKMTDLVAQNTNLPDIMEDLAKFILFSREKITAVRAEIRAISKLKLAEEVLAQKRQEAQMLAETVLDAEVRLGELFKEIPTKQGKRTDLKLLPTGEYKLYKSKREIINGLGFSQPTAQRFETLAGNAEIVEQVKAEARENGEYPTRTRVLELAAYQKRQGNEFEEYDRYVDLRVSMYKKLTKIIDLIHDFEITSHNMEALRDNFDGVVVRLEDQIRYMNESIEKMNVIKLEIQKPKKHRLSFSK